MYRVKIPAIATAKIEIIAKTRDEAISSAFTLIEDGDISLNWIFIKNIEPSIKDFNLISSKLTINEEIINEWENRYIISIPCTGFAFANIYASDENKAIKTAINFLKTKNDRIQDIKAHNNILFSTYELIKAQAYEITEDKICIECASQLELKNCFACNRFICKKCSTRNNEKHTSNTSKSKLKDLCEYCASEYYRGF